MKKLFLVRHAKSSWDHPDLLDIERPLNKRGKRDAPFMANIMKKKGISVDIIYSSPALRAFTTAEIFAKEFGISKKDIIIDKEIYQSSIKYLSKIINNIPDSNNEVMIFGHNPEFTTFANHIGNRIIDIMPTCSIVGIEFKLTSWKEVERGKGNTILFEYPKKYFTD